MTTLRLFALAVVLSLALTFVLVIYTPVDVRAESVQWTAEQRATILLIYRYAEFYGLRDVDRDLMLRIGYREGNFTNAAGDCWFGTCHSFSTFQLYDKGIYLSSPQMAEYGLAGRHDPETAIAMTAWAINHGMISHWRPNLRPLGRWLATVPPDPRLTTEGGP